MNHLFVYSSTNTAWLSKHVLNALVLLALLHRLPSEALVCEWLPYVHAPSTNGGVAHRLDGWRVMLCFFPNVLDCCYEKNSRYVGNETIMIW